MAHDISSNGSNGKSRGHGGEPWPKSVMHDFMASIVVFLVAMPLCMGIAAASNVPVTAGLITGVIGGIVVGLIAGAPLQVSGPAAGLLVLVHQLVGKYGLEALAFVVIVAGIVQILAGLLRLGQWFRAVSPAVVQGMLAGIGVLIFASQFHVMVDDDPRSGGVQNLLSIPASIWKGIIPQDGTTYHHAALIGLLTIVVLAVWKLLIPKKLKFIPAPLAAVVIAVLVARLLSLDILFIEPNGLIEGIRVPSLETWGKVQANGMGIVELLLAGLSFGLVASAETLLAVTATDRMHQGPRAKYDRELFAQGVGNLLCGFATALPMTGVIVRSTANIDAGARTRLSAILHGVWILLFVSILPHWLEAVPKACLGAILVYTGYKLVNPRSAMSLWAYGKGEFFIYLTTLVMIVVTDLLTGVLVGIGLSALKLLYTFSHLRIDVRHDRTNNRCNLKLVGAVTFLRLPKLADAIEHLPPNCELNVDVSRVDYIDHACLDLLMNWQQQHEDQGGKLIIDWGQLHQKFFNGPGRSLTQSGPISPQDAKKLKALQH